MVGFHVDAKNCCRDKFTELSKRLFFLLPSTTLNRTHLAERVSSIGIPSTAVVVTCGSFRVHSVRYLLKRSIVRAVVQGGGALQSEAVVIFLIVGVVVVAAVVVGVVVPVFLYIRTYVDLESGVGCH